MARQVERLKALVVARLKKPGLYPDGAGLYLQVTSPTGRSWLFRYMFKGRARVMGLGSLDAVTLAEAREKAATNRRLLRAGIDPIAERDAREAAIAAQAASAITFKDCAEQYIAAHETSWHNAKHVAQWKATLATYAYPIVGDLAVQAVDLPQIMKILEPIWSTKRETASRLRGRIESVLSWATARRYRQGENPARWRGHLDNLLPKRSKTRSVRHHPAIDHADVGQFMERLREQGGAAARALEFTILTAARTSEAIGARWDEIDMATATWTVPGERIKAGKEHRVPLSTGVMAILKEAMANRDKASPYVFQAPGRGRPLSDMALLAVLDRMGRRDITVHGFRSTFRDWCSEATNFPSHVAEMALAHAIGDKVEAAYRRGDLFTKRRQLMDAWAKHCAIVRKNTSNPTVVQLHAG